MMLSHMNRQMEPSGSLSATWFKLPNGNLMHRCGIELVKDGRQWRMTDQSGLEFAWFAIREQGLSRHEAQGLANLLVEQGALWADHGLH